MMKISFCFNTDTTPEEIVDSLNKNEVNKSIRDF